jgi:Ca-activated chloride channel family protein
VDGHGEVLATWTEEDPAQVHAGVAALVGARRLQQLEALKGARYTPEELRERVERLGMTPAEAGTETKALYPENQSADETLANLICAESLRSGIASTETAFVAVRTEAGKSVERTIIVANATPEGWEEARPVMMAPAGVVRGPMAAFLESPLEAVCEESVFMEDVQPTRSQYLAADQATSVAMPSQLEPSTVTLFDGVPGAGVGRIVLAERTIGRKGAKGLQADRLLSLTAAGDPATFPESAELLLFVGDMARARARVRLSDLLGGATRPLNITCTTGQTLRLVLLIPGTATQTLGHLMVTLGIA